jgi:hypothetical protein
MLKSPAHAHCLLKTKVFIFSLWPFLGCLPSLHAPYVNANCVSRLCLIVFSEVASRFPCARTKSTAVIKNVLHLHTIEQAISDSQYYDRISADAINSNTKKVPIVAQCFACESGMQVKLLHVVHA